MNTCQQIVYGPWQLDCAPCGKPAIFAEGGYWWCKTCAPSELLSRDVALAIWQKERGITGVEWQRRQVKEHVERKLKGLEC